MKVANHDKLEPMELRQNVDSDIQTLVYRGYRIMEVENKSAVGSVTIWGGLLALLPIIDQGLQILTQNAQILPAAVVPYVTAIGGIAAILGRLRRDIKPINSILVKKTELE